MYNVEKLPPWAKSASSKKWNTITTRARNLYIYIYSSRHICIAKCKLYSCTTLLQPHGTLPPHPTALLHSYGTLQPYDTLPPLGMLPPQLTALLQPLGTQPPHLKALLQQNDTLPPHLTAQLQPHGTLPSHATLPLHSTLPMSANTLRHKWTNTRHSTEVEWQAQLHSTSV